MKFTKKEGLLVIPSLILLLVISFMFKASIASIVVSTSGVIYCFLIGKRLRAGYFFGIINVTLYGVLLFKDGIYGGTIYNLFYGLPILLYGYYYWSNKKKDSSINKFNNKQKVIFDFIYTFVILVSVIYLTLNKDIIKTLDVFTTLTGIIGMYLLSNKYKEQWPIWIVGNFANSVLWMFLTINNISNIPVLLMWLFYFFNSLYGYYNWQK